MKVDNRTKYLFQLDKDLKDTLQEHCKQKDMSLAKLIRDLLREYARNNDIGA